MQSGNNTSVQFIVMFRSKRCKLDNMVVLPCYATGNTRREESTKKKGAPGAETHLPAPVLLLTIMECVNEYNFDY